jgi:hypothetical protein
MALGALGAHAHVAAAHTLLIGDGVAVLTGRGWGEGQGHPVQPAPGALLPGEARLGVA